MKISGEARRCAIYCLYDRYGHAASYVEYFLAELRKSVTELIIVVNGSLNDDSRQQLERYADAIMVRENTGLDAAAYRQGMLTIGWERLMTFDEIICLNDTVLGPVYPFEEMFAEMDSRDVDFWGITAYPAEQSYNGERIPTHLQAYWHAYRRSLIVSPAFRQYWEDMPVYEDYAEVTRKHEMTFTRRFAEQGFVWSSYVDYRKYRSKSAYPLLYIPVQLIRDEHCPVFKRRSFFLEYQYYFDQTAGQPGLELFEYLRDNTSYNVGLIWNALLHSFNIADVAKAMHLNYVLPSGARNRRIGGDIRSAFIYHVYFVDLLDQTLSYLSHLPESTDLYITTNEEKIGIIQDAMNRTSGFTHTVHFIPVRNRGRDVSALLVGARDVVLDGGYDVIGFAHDKKSGQNQAAGHHDTETEGFAYKLLENTLGTSLYVDNILTQFANDPYLGMLAPPPPIHALYFAHTMPNDWGPNFTNTKNLLENILHIHVPLDERKPTMSAIGSCYWFRVDALRPLFEHRWSYEDFPAEEEMGVDGTISHAIERANGYIVQSRGYYPAWVMNDRYVRIEIDSLYHMGDAMLNTIGRHLRGETLMQVCGELRASLSFFDSIKRNIHLALSGVFVRVTRSLPDSVRESLRMVLWTPIRYCHSVRATLNRLMKHKRRR